MSFRTYSKFGKHVPIRFSIKSPFQPKKMFALNLSEQKIEINLEGKHPVKTIKDQITANPLYENKQIHLYFNEKELKDDEEFDLSQVTDMENNPLIIVSEDELSPKLLLKENSFDMLEYPFSQFSFEAITYKQKTSQKNKQRKHRFNRLKYPEKESYTETLIIRPLHEDQTKEHTYDTELLNKPIIPNILVDNMAPAPIFKPLKKGIKVDVRQEIPVLNDIAGRDIGRVIRREEINAVDDEQQNHDEEIQTDANNNENQDNNNQNEQQKHDEEAQTNANNNENQNENGNAANPAENNNNERPEVEQQAQDENHNEQEQQEMPEINNNAENIQQEENIHEEQINENNDLQNEINEIIEQQQDENHDNEPIQNENEQHNQENQQNENNADRAEMERNAGDLLFRVLNLFARRANANNQETEETNESSSESSDESNEEKEEEKGKGEYDLYDPRAEALYDRLDNLNEEYYSDEYEEEEDSNVKVPNTDDEILPVERVRKHKKHHIKTQEEIEKAKQEREEKIKKAKEDAMEKTKKLLEEAQFMEEEDSYDDKGSLKPGRVRRVKLLRQKLDFSRRNEMTYPPVLYSGIYSNKQRHELTNLSKIGFDMSLVIEKYEENGRDEDKTRVALINLL